MLRVAIIGCGKIADQHAQAIMRIDDCEVVAVCDREPLMAEQLAERFRISASFSDIGSMLKSVTPDIVHVTTPPQSHFPIARSCLEAGCHVYVEKPFTVTANEAERLIELARASDLKITAGHNLQFTTEMLEMRRWIGRGFLGGAPVHVESYFSYDLGDISYVAPALGRLTHWVRRLPGQLLHNIVSHGIAKMAEFLDDDWDELVATAHQSPQLGSLGAHEVMDELRVMIRDIRGTTAYFCFSTQLRPALNQLRLFGPSNSLIVDHGTGSLIRIPNRPVKSYLAYFLPPLRSAGEHIRCAHSNLMSFLSRRLYQDFGMKELIQRFYASIAAGKEAPPIPYREIMLTARIMDEIFAQIYPRTKMENEPAAPVIG